MKTLILTPNKVEMCGMYQLAKDLAKGFDGVVGTKEDLVAIRYVNHNKIKYVVPTK